MTSAFIDDSGFTPLDQAAGLRRLFAGRALRFIPVVSNPFAAFSGLLIERLCTVLSDMPLNTLVIDAGENAPAPNELSKFDLAEGFEALSARVTYLAARGLPARHADSHGSTRAFLESIIDHAPFAQVAIVHGSAVELARLYGRDHVAAPRPLVLCDEGPEAIKHAYASLKMLATRADWHTHDLLLCAQPDSPRAAQVAQRLAGCVENFIGGVQRGWAAVDPAEPASATPAADLVALVRELVESCPPLACAALPHHTPSSFAALPATRHDVR